MITMRALIITDETGSKYPPIDYVNNKVGTGYDILKYAPIINILSDNSFPIPTTNYELEDEYKKLLPNYIRPAKLMFGGVFNEVRRFYNQMIGIISTDLMIISSRYGLITGDYPIIPYYSESFTTESVPIIDKKTHFLIDLISIQDKYEFVIILLSGPILRYCLKNNWFKTLPKEQKKFCVSGDSLHEELSLVPKMFRFKKKGVVRLGKKNGDEILNNVKEILRDNN